MLPLSEAIRNLFYYSAAINLNVDLEDVKKILKDMLNRLHKDQIDLNELSPQVKKTFVFYCQNQVFFA